jgi:site-specific recombinase XerD
LQEEYDDLASPSQITIVHIVKWLAYLGSFNLAPTTIHKKLAAMKTYWNFIELEGYSKTNPMKSIGLPRSLPLSKSTLSLSNKEEKWLMEEVGKEKNEWKKMRNICMIYVMLYLGLRVSEIIQLKRGDFLAKQQILKVQDEDGNVRDLPLTPFLSDSLSDWIALSNPSFFLFPSNAEGKQLTRQALHYIVKKYLQASGKGHHSAQSLRNTFIKRCLRDGMTLTNISKLLGLKTTESLQKYK